MSAVFPITAAEAADLADEFESRTAEDVMRWTADRFGGRAVLTCSWQKQSSVLVHMLSEVAPELRVVEFDTGLLFPETYETRRQLIERYPINFERIEPELSVEQQGAVHGERLWERDPDACCGMRKVAPLERALEGMDAWITGIRRDQSTKSAKRTQNRIGRTPRRGQGSTLGGLDQPRCMALHLETRHSLQHPARPRLSVDRVHAVHDVGDRRAA